MIEQIVALAYGLMFVAIAAGVLFIGVLIMVFVPWVVFGFLILMIAYAVGSEYVDSRKWNR